MKTCSIGFAALMIISTINAQTDNIISTNYIVEYPDDECSSAPDPDPVTVMIPIKSRALIVMQNAASENSDVRFSATYFGSELGYFIDKLNGTNSDLDESCFWFIYIRDPKGNEFLSPLGVSNFIIRGPGYSIIWRFQQYIPENSTHSNDTEPLVDLPTVPEPEDTVMVRYSIEYEDTETCGQGLELIPPPEVQTEIALLGSAQRVLEESVEFGRDYRFKVSFFNNEFGYFVDAINGTSGNVTTGCFWLFYIRLPNGTEFQPNVGISNYPIPADGHSVIMRYEFAQHITSVPDTTTTVMVPDTTTTVIDGQFVTEAQNRIQMLLSTVLMMTFFVVILVY